jgi:hypothetical protein
MGKFNALLKWTKERNAIPQQNRNHGHGDLINQSLREKAPDGIAAVDVDVIHAFAGESLQERGWRLCRMGDGIWNGFRNRNRIAAQDDDRRFPITPTTEGDHFLEGLASHHQHVDRIHELLEATVLSFRNRGARLIQPVKRAVGSGDEAIQTGGDVHGCLRFHASASLASRRLSRGFPDWGGAFRIASMNSISGIAVAVAGAIFFAGNVPAQVPAVDPVAESLKGKLSSSVAVLLEHHRKQRRYKNVDFPMPRPAFAKFRADVQGELTRRLGLEKWVVRNLVGKVSPGDLRFCRHGDREFYAMNCELGKSGIINAGVSQKPAGQESLDP